MSYDYQTLRPFLFTDEGQRMFLHIRDRAKVLLNQAGAARMHALYAGESGDVWNMMACVDRLVELGELRELDLPHVAGQYRTFVASGE